MFRLLPLADIVASAPKGLQLSLQNDDPPVVSATWQRPRLTYGNLEGYRLRYSIQGDSNVEERRFQGEKYHFTSGFLGQYEYWDSSWGERLSCIGIFGCGPLALV